MVGTTEGVCASPRASRIGVAYVLALLAAVDHAEERPDEPVGPDVFYVSVVSGDAARGVSPASVRLASVECGWEDPPVGATVACATPVVEGAPRGIAVRNVNDEGEPVPAETDLEFRYSTMPITATADVDYVSASETLTIKAGEIVSAAATLNTLEDALDEFQELFAVQLESTREFPVDLEFDYVVIPINDNDPEVRISLRGEEVVENAGVLSFEVSLRGKSGKQVTVDYATADGTATADTDYLTASGTLTFEPGETAQTVEVGIIDDSVFEPVEWFEFKLSNARNARLPRAPARGTIQDDEVLLTVAGASAKENSGALEFTVTADGMMTGAPVTVAYTTEDGTATAGDDYDAVSGTLKFTGESATQIVSVPLVDDDIDEPSETLTVVLADAVNAMIGTATASGVIEDDDPLPELRIDGGSAEEGGMIAFVVTLAGPTAQTVTVDYATADGSATAGADYRSVSGTLFFAPGVSSAALPVEIVDDENYEPDETFVARLSSPVNAAIVAGEATGTIVDDDEEPAAVAILPEDPTLCVGGAPTIIDLSRHFSGDNLSFSVSDPDPSVATVGLDDEVLVLTPVAEGTTSVTVTAANMGSRASFDLTITVVADPAELAAVKRGLAVAGGLILNDVVDAIGERFAIADTSDRRSNAAAPATTALDHRGAASVLAGNWSANYGDLATRKASEEWPPRDLSPDSRSLAFSASPGSGLGNWSVWGRSSTKRFGDGELLEDGSFTALQIGADARRGDWLFGAAGMLGRTDAEYGFVRSVEACGGGGTGEGLLETETTSVHPYIGRRVGRGWVWATAGAGSGEAIVERCTSGNRNVADLSMRMGALGGRHLIRGNDRLEVSLVEDLGVLRAKTDASMGPAGNHNVSVGRARFGVEARGVCATGAGIVGWARAFARHDWGDGIEGSGAEIALGARLDAPERRLRIDAGLRALAAHTADEHREIGASVSVAYLPQANGTGLQVSMALRRGMSDETARLGENWELSLDPTAARRSVRADMFVGYGFRARRGLARPFATVGKSNQGRRVAAGLRYESLGGRSGFISELSFGQEQGVGDGGFVLARLESQR